jgi:hypothetical protein
MKHDLKGKIYDIHFCNRGNLTGSVMRVDQVIRGKPGSEVITNRCPNKLSYLAKLHKTFRHAHKNNFKRSAVEYLYVKNVIFGSPLAFRSSTILYNTQNVCQLLFISGTFLFLYVRW